MGSSHCDIGWSCKGLTIEILLTLLLIGRSVYHCDTESWKKFKEEKILNTNPIFQFSRTDLNPSSSPASKLNIWSLSWLLKKRFVIPTGSTHSWKRIISYWSIHRGGCAQLVVLLTKYSFITWILLSFGDQFWGERFNLIQHRNSYRSYVINDFVLNDFVQKLHNWIIFYSLRIKPNFHVYSTAMHVDV